MCATLEGFIAQVNFTQLLRWLFFFFFLGWLSRRWKTHVCCENQNYSFWVLPAIKSQLLEQSGNKHHCVKQHSLMREKLVTIISYKDCFHTSVYCIWNYILPTLTQIRVCELFEKWNKYKYITYAWCKLTVNKALLTEKLTFYDVWVSNLNLITDYILISNKQTQQSFYSQSRPLLLTVFCKRTKTAASVEMIQVESAGFGVEVHFICQTLNPFTKHHARQEYKIYMFDHFKLINFSVFSFAGVVSWALLSNFDQQFCCIFLFFCFFALLRILNHEGSVNNSIQGLISNNVH